MPPDFATLSLAGSGYERRPWVRQSKWRDGYLDRFDSTTVWLDAVWHAGRVVLIMPRLNNLKKTVGSAEFRLDGHPVRARVRSYYRHVFAYLPAQTPPRRVSITLGDWTGETDVQSGQLERFAGRNVLFTLSKDDDPAWIEDWARFHRVHHGADAVLFVDNGSAHGTAPISQALTRAGLPEHMVLSTPLRYGPRGKAPFSNSELFLQTGVMNACRFRFLMQARAVLANDIDELIVSDGGSIFDRAVSSRLGYVAARGQWMYPDPQHAGRACHADHVWRKEPPEPCPQKWCIVPDGPLRHWSWRVHKLDGLPFGALYNAKDMRLLHCRGVTTGWKGHGRLEAGQGLVHDPLACDAMEQAGLPQRGNAQTGVDRMEQSAPEIGDRVQGR